MKIIREASDPVYLEQTPALVASLSQPLLVNGKFLEAGTSELTRRLGQIGWEKSAINEGDIKNRILHNALILFHQIITLRTTAEYLEAQLKLFDLELKRGQDNRALGRISETDLLDLELRQSRQESLIFDTKYQILTAEQSLSALLGETGLAAAKLEWELSFRKDSPGSSGNSGTDAAKEGFILLREKSLNQLPGDDSSSPKTASAFLTLEEQQIRSRLAGVSDGVIADLSLAFSPQYPKTRSNPEKYAASFTDFLEEDAVSLLSIALSLKIPLNSGEEIKIRKNLERLSEETTRLSLEKSRREALDTRNYLAQRLLVLEEKARFISSQS